jgi:hypothetical protein
MTLSKPAHGSPCNGCGVCCQITLCPVGIAQFGHKAGPCEAIQTEAGKAVCGLVANPQRYAPLKVARFGVEKLRSAAMLLISSGKGCDFYFHGEPTSKAFYDKMNDYQNSNRKRWLRARAIWGVTDDVVRLSKQKS